MASPPRCRFFFTRRASKRSCLALMIGLWRQQEHRTASGWYSDPSVGHQPRITAPVTIWGRHSTPPRPFFLSRFPGLTCPIAVLAAIVMPSLLRAAVRLRAVLDPARWSWRYGWGLVGIDPLR